MHGFQLTFYTEQNRKHGSLPISEWLVEEAQRQGIQGVTVIAASEGFGHSGKVHSARFFELSDQPVEVTLALSPEEAEKFFRRLQEEKLDIFYLKKPIEFGMTSTLWS